ncbi:hypothetical protein N657DRAFT_658928 [Parathielavia appendiculata]|uniref:polynucleotide adenylyltransferase n=1 Tax=Parathielavia appendiculata TaxID=2587402 RepID=A0AAN6TS83_9PEZI|nr:hypothetical protein N657DRAFT_658928 [Parathielavia appendiculata]
MSYNTRNSHSRGDYRPPPRDYRNDRDSRNRNGPSRRNAYRPPSYNAGRNDRDNDARWPREGANGDSYRVPQGDFTFRVDKPAGVQEADTYRPQTHRKGRNDGHEPSPNRDSRPAKRNRTAHDSSSRDGNINQPFRDNRSARGGHGHRPWRPFIAAERELLKANHTTGSEVAFFKTDGSVTYRPLDELSDSDEAEMDISGDEAEPAEGPSSKRARTAVEQSASDNSAPKWSNPDPYTALPPEMTTQGKKKDVVQMIRKARVSTQEVRTSLPSESADFIALDFDDSDAEDDDDYEPKEPAASAAPSVATTNSTHSVQLDLRLPPKPVSAKLAKAAARFPDPTPAALGSRKRTHDDEIKMPHTKLKRAITHKASGRVTDEWLRDPELDPTPWMRADHSRSANMAVWLHKEVVDFYDYIRPRDFEERLRGELVQDLKKFCRKVFKDGEVYPFGSFPSGLYLPTADMDLVFMSDGYASGGGAKYHTKTFLYRFRGQLVNHKIAWENEIELIVGAKVPLVKFIEHKTGLKVDVSFENNTGLTAINTFKAWREQYPGMPALVTLIKHFLLMRGLNEPVNGGIGGFSVICLVVSMLQMMPEVQSGNLDTRHHLGQLLLHFFDLYGNRFNYQTIAIGLNPPRWIPKHQVTEFAYKNHDRLSIIDPNNPANDIAGGSSNARTIISHFAHAHQQLTQRMAQLAQDPNRAGQSILEVILGGNYSSFEKQRNYLEKLAKEGYRPTGQHNRPAEHEQKNRPAGSHNRPARSQAAHPQRPSQQGRNGGGGSRKRR